MPMDRYIKYKDISKFTNEFRRELGSSMQELAETSFRGLQQTASGKARSLARERLPSGGESYAKTIHTEETRAYGKWGGRIYSDHEWAEAIEWGTEPHDIPKNPRNESIEEYVKREAWEKATDYAKQQGFYTEGIRRPKTSFDPERHKSKSYYHKKSGEVKIGLKGTGELDKENIADYYRRSRKEELFELGAHEYTHYLRHKAGKDKGMGFGEERVARQAQRYAIDRGMGKRQTAPIHITEHLPNYSGKSANWGTRYVQDDVYFTQVKHPGARAFYIFRDTLKHVGEQADNILDRALRRVGFH